MKINEGRPGQGGVLANVADQGEKKYISEADFRGKNKLFKCDITSGEVVRVQPEKEYFRNTKTGAITAHYFIWSRMEYFYVSAKNLNEAVEKFEVMLAKISEKIEEKGLAKEK